MEQFMKNSIFKISAVALALSASTAATAVSKKELDQRLQAIEASSASYQSRLGKLERSTSTQVMVEMLQRVEQLQAENAELRGLVEEQMNEVERLRKRQRDLYLDVDRRLSDIQLNTTPVAESSTVPANVTAVTSVISAGSGGEQSMTTPAEEVAPAVDPAQERQEYEGAFNFLREGRHGDAIAAFKQYLNNYPQGRYAHNARYWMGEAHYVTRKFDQALVDFQKVLDDYPNSNKVPDASLKLGYTYYELKDFDQARKVLAGVVKQYPTSKAASLAEKRLLSMGKDGL